RRGGAPMIRVSVLYPYTEGARFDADYYANHHMALVRERFAEHGLVDIRVERGLVGPTPGSDPLYAGMG
ncbi:MAG: EthD family reductase, partial [Gammaproteobacteria bacterium]|nr:EthD family reductase [Gammaproteobacteria bacterium]